MQFAETQARIRLPVLNMQRTISYAHTVASLLQQMNYVESSRLIRIASFTFFIMEASI